MEIERRGPDSEPKRGILKHLSAEFFHWKSEINQVKLRMNVELNGTCQWHLRSKIGVWHMHSGPKKLTPLCPYYLMM